MLWASTGEIEYSIARFAIDLDLQRKGRAIIDMIFCFEILAFKAH